MPLYIGKAIEVGVMASNLVLCCVVVITASSRALSVFRALRDPNKELTYTGENIVFIETQTEQLTTYICSRQNTGLKI